MTTKVLYNLDHKVLRRLHILALKPSLQKVNYYLTTKLKPQITCVMTKHVHMTIACLLHFKITAYFDIFQFKIFRHGMSLTYSEYVSDNVVC